MARHAAFCFMCGAATVVRYPGGDPENGPAGSRCRDDTHESLADAVEAGVSESSESVIDNFLVEMGQGQRHTVLSTGPQYVAIPPAVRLAALVLQADREEQDHLSAQAYAEQEAAAKAANPYGPVDEGDEDLKRDQLVAYTAPQQ